MQIAVTWTSYEGRKKGRILWLRNPKELYRCTESGELFRTAVWKIKLSCCSVGPTNNLRIQDIRCNYQERGDGLSNPCQSEYANRQQVEDRCKYSTKEKWKKKEGNIPRSYLVYYGSRSSEDAGIMKDLASPAEFLSGRV